MSTFGNHHHHHRISPPSFRAAQSRSGKRARERQGRRGTHRRRRHRAREKTGGGGGVFANTVCSFLTRKSIVFCATKTRSLKYTGRSASGRREDSRRPSLGQKVSHVLRRRRPRVIVVVVVVIVLALLSSRFCPGRRCSRRVKDV